jgi:NAD(P)-dependent dehydrogenase (short-subunit alcohol dehydrogenase family)
VLVNNAGIAKSQRFLDTTRAIWDETLAVNLTGVYLCTQQVLPAMLDGKYGRVVNIASTSALRGYKTMAAYCAAKHGVLGLTRVLALETAAHGVTVNAICPGYVETDIFEQAIQNLMSARNIERDEARQMLARPIPTGRFTTVEEVASAVDWLCSPTAANVTGIAVPLTGGEVQ